MKLEEKKVAFQHGSHSSDDHELKIQFLCKEGKGKEKGLNPTRSANVQQAVGAKLQILVISSQLDRLKRKTIPFYLLIP